MDISNLPPQLDSVATGVARQAPRQSSASVQANAGSSRNNQLAAQASASSGTGLAVPVRNAAQSPRVPRGSIVNIVV